jgi:fatty acid desaturase
MRKSGQSTAGTVKRAGRTAETVPIEHETRERLVRTGIIGVPVVALGCAGWLAWGGSLHWQDLLVLAITYALTGVGITVGFHRLFTHRSFKTTRAVRALLAVFGSMAVEGSVIEWVATHRKHHSFSDRPGDPHSPQRSSAPPSTRSSGPRESESFGRRSGPRTPTRTRSGSCARCARNASTGCSSSAGPSSSASCASTSTITTASARTERSSCARRSPRRR